MDSEPNAAPDAAAELSQHLAESIDELKAFHEAHYRGASWLQRVIDRLTAMVGTPIALVVMTLGVAAWIGAALMIGPRGAGQDAFGWLELAATCVALLVAVLILVTQRREDVLAQRRNQLILELAILSDKKAAKIIALLEEMRRDSPHVHDRVDPESDDMATPTNVLEVVAAIDQTTAPSADPSDGKAAG
jgi:uncharacterized membrane protein